MQLPDNWCVEFPDFRALLVSPIIMLGEDWYRDGSHRYRARISVPESSPFGELEATTKKVGVQAKWDKNAGWLRLNGDGWGAVASVGGGPEFALGTYVTDRHFELRFAPRA